jgi:signal transduction histidine kinase
LGRREGQQLGGVDGGDGVDSFDVLNESVVRFDAAGVILGWNTQSEILYGIARPAALGASLTVLLGEDGSWPERLAGVDAWEGEVVRPTASGPMPIQVRWAARRDAAGEVVDVFETGRSASELTVLRQQARESTYRYENLFQALAVGFFETDFREVGTELIRLWKEGVTDLRAYLLANPAYVRELMNFENVLDANAAAVKLFAADDVEDLKGPRSTRYWPDESIPDYVEALIAVMEKQPQFVCETKLRTLDGRLLDVLFTVAWSPESAKRGIMIVGVVDLGDRNRAFAELKRSETKHRKLLDAMSIGFVEYDFSDADRLLQAYRSQGVVDLGGHLLADAGRMAEMLQAVRVSAVNDRALEIFGLPPEARMPSGVGWLWPPSGYPTIARAIDGRYQGRTMPPVETRLQRVDGRVIDVAFTVWAEPERRSDQPVLCGIVDISERVAAYSRLEQVQAEFAHASRIATLGELAATVAHEISQPLTAISTNSETAVRMLERDPPDMPFLRSLNRRTLDASQRAVGIVARIRSVASPAMPVRTALDLNEVVVEALPFVRNELQHAGISPTIVFAPVLPMIEGDRVQLQQVVVNLVLNAVQAMQVIDPGQRRLAIVGVADDRGVRLTIEDGGPGLPAGEEQRIWESFYTTKSGGMGIGLAVCRSIIESHGGTIEAEAMAQGARFSIVLPIPGRD